MLFSDVLYSDCAKCLLSLLNTKSRIVISLKSGIRLPLYQFQKKKGDLSDCNNYCSISLINVGLKIISKMVKPEQFGFRNKEECISLYIIFQFRKICQRKKI